MDDNQILALGRAGEDEATEFLLQKYGYLVKREVRTVYLIGAETEDLAQEGMIGLFKAIRDYSPDKAASFSTFASVCIRRQIQNAITNSNRKKHVPLNSYVSLYMNSEEGDNFMLEERLSTSREEDPEKLLIAREQIEDRNARIKKELSKLEQQVLNCICRDFPTRRSQNSSERQRSRLTMHCSVSVGNYQGNKIAP